jgi:hypothetical protein
MFKLIFTLYFLTPLILQGQTTANIDSDRPGQAISSTPMRLKDFQIQTGGDLYCFNPTSQFNILIPSTTFRYGITKNSELNYTSILSSFIPSVNKKFVSNMSNGIGIRTRIDKNDILALSLQAEGILTQDLESGNSPQLNLRTVFISTTSLTQKIDFLLNLGVNYNTKTITFNSNYILNLSYSFSKNSAVFIENYGNFGIFSFETFWDSGLAYCLTPNFQIDCSFGSSIISITRNYFISTGLSIRLVNKTQQKNIE